MASAVTVNSSHQSTDPSVLDSGNQSVDCAILDSGSQPTDHSILRTPIQIDMESALQVTKCVQSGTKEVRDLLLYECELIFECKVCLSLFRALPNFLAHKRVYCKQLHREEVTPGGNENQSKDQSTGAQSQQPSGGNTPAEEQALFSVVGETTVERGNASSSIQVVADEDVLEASSVLEQMKQGRFQFGKIHTRAAERTERKQGKKNVNLSSVEGTTDIANEDETEKDADDQDEEEEEEAENEDAATDVPVRMTLRSQSHSPSTSHSSVALKLSQRSDCDINTLTCLKCKASYASIKTLNFHMTSLHSEKRRFYPCMFCDNVFVQLWGVTRHINRAHDKTKDEVARLTNTLKGMAYYKPIEELGEYVNPRRPVPGSFPSIKRDNLAKSVRKAGGARGRKEKVTQIRFSPSITLHRCRTCNKAFRKKESLDSHSVGCTGNNPETRDQPVTRSSAERGRVVRKIKFSPTFQLHKCSTCDKVFGKEELLCKHIPECTGTTSNTMTVIDVEEDDVEQVEYIEEANQDAERTEYDFDDEGRTLQHGNSNTGETKGFQSEFDASYYIDENKLMCLKCNKSFGCISNLNRHAVRHLGWRRFKCKICKFTGYNRSECKSHLKRVHRPQLKQDINDLSMYIMDLDKDKMTKQLVSTPRCEMDDSRRKQRKQTGPGLLKKPYKPVRVLQKAKNQTPESPRRAGIQTTNQKRQEKSTFNISTRRTPRTYDTQPYQRDDGMSSLKTRSGSYPKPALVKKRRNSGSESSDEDDEEEAAEVQEVTVNEEDGVVTLYGDHSVDGTEQSQVVIFMMDSESGATVTQLGTVVPVSVAGQEIPVQAMQGSGKEIKSEGPSQPQNIYTFEKNSCTMETFVEDTPSESTLVSQGTDPLSIEGERETILQLIGEDQATDPMQYINREVRIQNTQN